LERDWGDPGECDAFTLVQRYRYGEPLPPIPPDAPRCGRCGEVHVFYEVIVATREEAQAVLALNEREVASE
jgi:hypothetical protein